MESKIDFRKLKLAVSITQVLEHYGVQVRRTTGSQLVADCPLPTHTSKESRNSLKLNVEKGIWCCMSESCYAGYSERLGGKKGGDSLDLVALKEDCTILQAAKLLLEWFPQDGNALQSPSPDSDKRIIQKSEQTSGRNGDASALVSSDIQVNKPLLFTLKGIQYCDYLEKRGITRETAAIFGAGFFPGKGSMADRVVIPIHDGAGQLLAYAGRAINGLEPKYLLPSGFHKHLVLYNLHRIGEQVDTAILVEGFFPVFWLTQCGFPALGLMGHCISDEQLNLLNFKNVILMLDSSEKGADVREKTLVRIASRCFVQSVMLPTAKQPDDLSKSELHSLLSPLM